MARWLLLVCLLLLAACQRKLDQADLSHITQASLLEQQQSGFSSPPITVAAQQLPGNWTAVELPRVTRRAVLPSQGLGEVTVTSWYRIVLPASMSAAARGDTLYLYLPRWKTIGQIAIYADGLLLLQSHANMVWNGYNHPLLVPLNDHAVSTAPREVLIRINWLRSEGVALSSVYLGSADSVAWRYRLRDWLQTQLPFMSSAAILAIGIFALMIWLVRRRDKIYLLFFVMAVSAYLRTLNYYVGSERLPISDEWFGWLALNSTFWLVVSTHFFMEALHQRRQAWLGWILLAITLCACGLTLPGLSWLPGVAALAPAGYLLLIATMALVFGAALRNSWLSRSGESRMLAAWGLLFALCGAHDWLLQNNRISVEHLYLAPYSVIGGFFLFMFVLFRRYIHAMRDVELINVNLEQRLQQREQELAASYRKLREAEHKQMLGQERQRLMQDMHDGLGSSLVSALRLVEHHDNGAAAQVDIAQVLKACINDLKLAIDSMEPVDADLLLLLATVRFRLGPQLQSTGIALDWAVTDVPRLDWLDPRNALHILRILQEAFANIIKHTQTTRITVATSHEQGRVLVTISDNGQGFDVEAALQQGGKGLQNQLRRAQAIGAEIVWRSHAGGSCMSLWLPVERVALNDGELSAGY